MSIRRLAILVVEDEPLIAMDIIVTLEAYGACGVGSARSLEEAERLLDESCAVPPFDVVVLDHRLVDGTSDKLARRLVEAGILVVLHTASSQTVKPLADELQIPLLPKPALEGDIVTAIRTISDERASIGTPKTRQPHVPHSERQALDCQLLSGDCCVTDYRARVLVPM